MQDDEVGAVRKEAGAFPAVLQDDGGLFAIALEFAGHVIEDQRKKTDSTAQRMPEVAAIEQGMTEDGKTAVAHRTRIHAEELVVERLGQHMPQGAILLGRHPALRVLEQFLADARTCQQRGYIPPLCTCCKNSLRYKLDGNTRFNHDS